MPSIWLTGPDSGGSAERGGKRMQLSYTQ